VATIKATNDGSTMNKLYKPNGVEVTVNDNSLDYALSIGWTKKKPVKKPVKESENKAK